MKRWQLLVIVLLLATAAWGIISHPPGSRVVQQVSLRTPSPSPTPDVRPITLLFVGDIMLSRSVGDTMSASGDWEWPFARVASTTAAADLAFANLETTISTGGAKNGCGYCFRANPKSVSGLVKAGFDVVTVANNHMWDFGPQAFTDTLSYLAVNDISVVGGGRSDVEAGAPIVHDVHGTRIAFLGYTDMLPSSATATSSRAGVNTWNEQAMQQQVAAARAMADVVIVAFHTGTEYEPLHNATQERIYHAIIDAGADFVVGTHPHVVQDIEQYNGKWIAYSLGNFVFDQNWSDATRKGMALSVTVVGGKITGLKRMSVDISKQYQATINDSGTSVQ